jgi:SNF2 family DNA or RNA helicase
MLTELTEDQKMVYYAYLARIREEIEKEIREQGFERSQIKILSGLTRLRQICCHPGTFLEGYDGESGKLLLLQEIFCLYLGRFLWILQLETLFQMKWEHRHARCLPTSKQY